MAYQKGSGFVGLQQYLNANQQQAQQMGQQVAGQIDTAYGGVRSEADQMLAGVQGQAAAGAPAYQDPADLATANERAAGVGTTYTGPEGLSNAQNAALEASAKKAVDTAALGGTDVGVATLLQQQRGRGYTGVGGRSLDAFLARRGAGVELDDASKTGMDGLRAYLGNTREKGIAAAEQGREAAAEVRGRYANDAATRYAPDMDTVKRNPIQTPGTMPAKKVPKGIRQTAVGRWLSGVLGGG